MYEKTSKEVVQGNYKEREAQHSYTQNEAVPIL